MVTSIQGNVVEEMEKQTCLLKPMVEGRIVVIKDKNVRTYFIIQY